MIESDPHLDMPPAGYLEQVKAPQTVHAHLQLDRTSTADFNAARAGLETLVRGTVAHHRATLAAQTLHCSHMLKFPRQQPASCLGLRD